MTVENQSAKIRYVRNGIPYFIGGIKMKLKQILSGLTATILALSSVAVASFTSSAADTIEPSNGWYETTGKLEGDQFKLIQDWGNQTKLPELYQKNELYIAIDVKGITTPIAAYMIFSNGVDWTAWNPDDNGNPLVQIDKDGVYVIPWKGTSSVNAEVVLFLAAAFKTADNSAVYYAADNGVTCSLIGVYLTDPSDELIDNNDDTSNSSSESSSKSSAPTTAPNSTSNITTTAPTSKVTPVAPKATKTTVAKPAKVKNVKVKAKKKKLNVSWKKVSGAKGYKVTYATNNKFTKGKKTSIVKKNKITIKNLKSNKKYYIKVRAFNNANGKKNFGPWSKVVKKKAK